MSPNNETPIKNDAVAAEMVGDIEKKALVISHLKKIPIVQIACEKAVVGRTTYYTWRKGDEVFAKQADEAIDEGEGVITDLTEAQLIALSKEKHFPAIMAWLRAHHPKYGDKIIVEATVRDDQPLTPQEQEIVKRALSLASFRLDENSDKKTASHGRRSHPRSHR